MWSRRLLVACVVAAGATSQAEVAHATPQQGETVRDFQTGTTYYLGLDGYRFQVDPAQLGAMSLPPVTRTVSSSEIADLPEATVGGTRVGVGAIATRSRVRAQRKESSYIKVGTQNFSFTTSDGRVGVKGVLNVFRGRGSDELYRRFEFGEGSKYYAIDPVVCFWGKLTYGFPNGSAGVPANFGISGSSVSDGWFGKCREGANATRPTFLGLYGVGYTKLLLNSVTVEVQISSSRNGVKRFWSSKKMGWGTVTPV